MKAATNPTAAGTCTYVSYQQGHWGQPQGLTSMCDMWHKGKQIGKSTIQQKTISVVWLAEQRCVPQEFIQNLGMLDKRT